MRRKFTERTADDELVEPYQPWEIGKDLVST
jgi:hypothetical protein